MLLTLDTETSGRANFALPPEHRSQPRLVQFGALLVDVDRKPVAEVDLLVRPEGYEIPAEATAVHGITTATALQYGLMMATVLKLFLTLARRAELTVVYNLDYDWLVLEGEFVRLGDARALADFRAIRAVCAMKAATDVCKIPGKRGGYKWPTLMEAHEKLCGVKFEGAHGALADSQAASRVWWALPDDIRIAVIAKASATAIPSPAPAA